MDINKFTEALKSTFNHPVRGRQVMGQLLDLEQRTDWVWSPIPHSDIFSTTWHSNPCIEICLSCARHSRWQRQITVTGSLVPASVLLNLHLWSVPHALWVSHKYNVGHFIQWTFMMLTLLLSGSLSNSESVLLLRTNLIHLPWVQTLLLRRTVLYTPS